MSRCRIGDLAVVIGGDFPENYGAIVSVVAHDQYRPDAWEVESEDRLLKGLDRITLSETWSQRATAGDSILRPIRGLTPDEIDRVQVEALERA